jgi:HEAT repeat protein
MAVTFLLQIGVAGFLLKKIGSTRSMLFLPAVLCIVFAALAVEGLGLFGTGTSQVMFWSIVCGMGMRVAFFDSFFSPNFQIFFSSLPQEIRGRGKLSIEGVIKPAAIVCASLWLLLAAPHIPFGINMAFLFVISGGVLLQTFNIRKKYTQSLTAFLTGFRSKKLPALFNLVEVPDAENFVAMLGGILEKEEYEIKKFIIEILAGMNSKESIGTLTDYMARCDGVTRATIISSLSRLTRPDLKPVFIRCLNDTDERVTANSILALAAFSDFETQEGLEVFLHHRNNRVRANAVVIMWRRWESEKRRQRLIDILQKMLWSDDADESASSLYAMGVLSSRSFIGTLEGFYETARDRIMSRPSVRRQFLTACAKIPCDKSFDMIIGLAEGQSNAYNDAVRGLGLLLENNFAASGLMRQVKESTHRKRSTILKAMVDRKYVLDKSCDALLEDVAHREVASIYADWLCLSVLDTKTSLPEVELLRTAVYETCVMEKTRNVIYLTALADRSGQVGSIIPRLTHKNRHVRARAFEVLDNVGMIKINRLLIGLLDSDDAAKHGREAMIGHKLRARPLMDTVSDYLFGREEWLATCALYACNALCISTKDVRWQDMYNRAAATGAGRTTGAVRS